jgi:hypothetical protein
VVAPILAVEQFCSDMPGSVRSVAPHGRAAPTLLDARPCLATFPAIGEAPTALHWTGDHANPLSGSSLDGVSELAGAAARLILSHRWAAMATVGSDGPAASMVAYAPAPDLSSVVLFLSGLSAHTGNLIADPRIALVVSEADPGTGDPQTLARVSVSGLADRVERTSPEFGPLWQTYVERLPDAAPRLDLADFSIFRVVVESARFVGGFAQAGTISTEGLSAAAIEPGVSD